MSFRNFWFLSCEDKWYDVCLAISGMSRQMAWESPFSVSLSLLLWRQGISLTTWMVVGETDKWNINFKFSWVFFDVVRHVEWELFQNGILLFWRKQISPFVLIVFFFFFLVHLFLWQRFISAQRTCCCRPSLMRCHKNRDVRSLGRD